MDKLFIGLIIGVLGGAVLGVLAIGDGSFGSTTSNEADSVAATESAEPNQELLQLQRKLSDLEAQLATARKDRDQAARDAGRYLDDRRELELELAAARQSSRSIPPSNNAEVLNPVEQEVLTAEEIAARKATAVRIAGEIKLSIESKDKAKVLEQLEALKALGPAASVEYFATLKEVLAVGTPQMWGGRGGNENANALGLDWNEYRRLMSRELRDVALEQAGGGQVPPEVMRLAGFLVREDPYMDQDRQVRLLTNMLQAAPDSETMSSAVRSLGRVGTPEAVSQLQSVATNGGTDASVREQAVWNLAGGSADDSTVEVIRSLQNDSEERVANAARRTLQRLRPPMTGYLIDWVSDQGQAKTVGMQAGDIIIRFNGQDVTSDNLRQYQNSIPEGVTGEVVLWRNGTTITVLVRRGQLGINGSFVRRVQQ